jgi:hypothetical protein
MQQCSSARPADWLLGQARPGDCCPRTAHAARAADCPSRPPGQPSPGRLLAPRAGCAQRCECTMMRPSAPCRGTCALALLLLLAVARESAGTATVEGCALSADQSCVCTASDGTEWDMTKYASPRPVVGPGGSGPQQRSPRAFQFWYYHWNLCGSVPIDPRCTSLAGANTSAYRLDNVGRCQQLGPDLNSPGLIGGGVRVTKLPSSSPSPCGQNGGLSIKFAPYSTCGPPENGPSSLPDCDMPDMGSCGSACCVVEFNITGGSSTEDAYNEMKAWLQKGGGDGSVAYRTGPDAAGHNPGDDVRQYNTPWDFILQGSHTTSGGFVDTLNINVKKQSSPGGPITLRAASTSDIHGALGDNGQHFKTLSYMVAQLRPQLSSEDMKVVHGCGSSADLAYNGASNGRIPAVQKGNSTCGPPQNGPSKVSDCNMPDFGSCGSACCVLEFNVTGSSTEGVYNEMKTWLQGGGGDGSVAYRTGPDAAGHNPGDDVRQYNTPWDFILQGSHTTSGGFVDTLNINVKKPGSPGGPITLRAASTSGIHGALGDNGQNFKTLAYMVAQTRPGAAMRVVQGCGVRGSYPLDPPLPPPLTSPFSLVVNVSCERSCVCVSCVACVD